MSHRIREAMRSNQLDPFGGVGAAVKVDETFIGRDPDIKFKGAGFSHKMKVLALVDRQSGRSRAYVIESLKAPEIAKIVFANVYAESRLMTDEAGHYQPIGRHYAEHSTVNHKALEYGRGDIHTNTIEGYFSIFKRGMKGIYQHCAKKHLHRYLAEFDFRYSNRVALGYNDAARADVLLSGIVGKRLTYQTVGRA